MQKFKLNLSLAILFCTLLSSLPTMAGAKELVVLTSHAETYVHPLQVAFERKHPDIKLRFLFKKTPAAIAHIQNNRPPTPDIFLASATDAFEGLKQLGKLSQLTASAPGPYDDPHGYYKGVALAGYGAMWNKGYLTEKKILPPRQWDDLLKPQYSGHIAITSPMRSGTMHVIVETILQSYGWEKGWAYLLELAGNLATITARSYGVSDGILKGRFGIGLVVDFFALGAKRKGQNVDFTYFPNTTLLPASGAVVAQSKSQKTATLFLNFLTSQDGQRLLVHPDIMRLPVVAKAYDVFPREFPNPFIKETFVETIEFDKTLSSKRYQLINIMFDQLITYRLPQLNRAWTLLHSLEERLNDNNTLKSVRKLLSKIPVGGMMSTDETFLAQFSHAFPGATKSTLQSRLEKEWESQGEKDIQRAMRLMHEVELKLESRP